MGYFTATATGWPRWGPSQVERAAPLQIPDDEWCEWADRVIADDLTNPERAARARRRLMERRRGFEVR